MKKPARFQAQPVVFKWNSQDGLGQKGGGGSEEEIDMPGEIAVCVPETIFEPRSTVRAPEPPDSINTRMHRRHAVQAGSA